ncbi:MAG: hypothetical protein AB7I04_15510 [Pseudomonadales bacterium]
MSLGRGLWLLLPILLGACAADDGWLDPDLPAGASAPHLAMTTDGRVVLSYLAPHEAAGTGLAFTVLDADGWSAPQQVAAGADWFVNWADFPSVVPVADELWAAHWLVRSAEDPYAYDAVVSLSRDGGRTWLPGAPLHGDGTPTEHGFVSLYPAADGVAAVWLDGRDLHADPNGAMQLLSAVVRAADGAVLEERPVDDRVCDCCQTDVAVTTAGPVVVFRDRSAEEIRDIAVSRLTSAGWTPSRIVGADGWQISGCPVNGPAIAAAGDRVVVGWYTGHPQRHLSVAFSADGAETFSTPVDVSAGATLGRVDVVLLPGGGAAVSWLSAVPGRLQFRTVAVDGSLGPIQTVADVSPERNAGFPQMIRWEQWLVFAWTDVASQRIRARRLPLPL